MPTFTEQLQIVQYRLFGPPQTVAIVFDECNLQLAARAFLGCRINYKKICDLILQDNRRVFTPPLIVTDATNGVDAFERAMKARGFDVIVVESKNIYGRIKNRTDGFVHQALYAAGDSEADVVALVSGDGDFEPALNYVKQIKGKVVEVYSLRDVLAMELWAVADRVVYLDELA